MSVLRTAAYSLILVASIGSPCDAADETRPLDMWDVLNRAQEFEVISLEPVPQKGEPAELFHGHKILGKTTLADADARRELLTKFYSWVEEVDSLEEAYQCFAPRHGIRAKHNGTTVDILVCYQCYAYRVHVTRDRAAIRAAAEKQFDGALQAAGVPLAKKDATPSDEPKETK